MAVGGNNDGARGSGGGGDGAIGGNGGDGDAHQNGGGGDANQNGGGGDANQNGGGGDAHQNGGGGDANQNGGGGDANQNGGGGDANQNGGGGEAIDVMLNIGVNRTRAVFCSIVMASALIGITVPFTGSGVHIDSFQSTIDAPEQKEKLDWYNFGSGIVTAFLMIFPDIFLSMLVAVLFLCIGMEITRRKKVLAFAIAVIGFVMNASFTAVNMQVSRGEIHPTILSSDLVVENGNQNSQPLAADGSLTTTSDPNLRESTPGNSVLNTIMRTLLTPTEEVPPFCKQSDEYTYFKNAIASYGFPARLWQQRALSRALEPTATLTIPMTSEVSDLPADENLPMNVSIATNLAVYALVVSNTFLG